MMSADNRVKKSKKLIKNDKGMTIVEVLVSFVILVILTGAFYAVIAYASRTAMEAKDDHDRIETFRMCLCKKDKSGLNETPITGSGNYTLAIDTVKTDSGNLPAGDPGDIMLNHMKAYKYTGDGTDDPKMERLRVDIYAYE